MEARHSLSSVRRGSVSGRSRYEAAWREWMSSKSTMIVKPESPGYLHIKTIRAVAVSLLVLNCAALALPKSKAPCKVFFVVVEQDAGTLNLKMVGLNKNQNEWYRKDDELSKGVCLRNPDQSGEQIALESVSEDYLDG